MDRIVRRGRKAALWASLFLLCGLTGQAAEGDPESQRKILTSLSGFSSNEKTSSAILNNKNLPFDKKVEQLAASIGNSDKPDAAGEIQELEAQLRDGAARGKLSPGTLDAMGKAYLHLGDKAKAAELASELMAAAPDNPKGFDLAARSHAAQGNNAKAKELAGLAFAKTPRGSPDRAAIMAFSKTLGHASAPVGHVAPAGNSRYGQRPGSRPTDKVDQDLVTAWKTPHGKDLLAAINPKVSGIKTEEEALENIRPLLKEAGVLVRSADSNESKRRYKAPDGDGSVNVARNEERGIRHVLVLDPDVAKDPNAAAAHAKLFRMYNEIKQGGLSEEEFNNRWLQLRGTVSGIYVTVQMKARGMWASAKTAFSQKMNFYELIFGKRVAETTVDVATYGKPGSQYAKSVGAMEKNYTPVQAVDNYMMSFEGQRYGYKNTSLDRAKLQEIDK